MMTADAAFKLLTVAEFLDQYDGVEGKFELDRGVVRARFPEGPSMIAGGTRRHAQIQANLIAAFKNRLSGSGCQPFGSDMGLFAGDFSLRYPDVSVFCDRDELAPEKDFEKCLRRPSVVIEILSRSTCVHDESIKLREYQLIDSLQTIIFIDPDGEVVTLHERGDGREWRTKLLHEIQDVDVKSLGFSLPRSEIFARD
jgi:Uma2 family endonuclease